MKKYARSVWLLMILVYSPIVGSAQDSPPLVHEGLVNAAVDKVWAAFTTKEGLESWLAPHADIELKIGGLMRSQHDAKGMVSDGSAIHNAVISFEPLHMLSIKVVKPPDGFPFPNAVKNMWTVIYFEPRGENATHVRVVGMGFGTDDESKKMRAFFDRGNAFTLLQLQKRFAAKTTK